MKTAIITGVTGQDGSYLADLLLEKGYRVVGTTREDTPEEELVNVAHLQGKIEIHEVDLSNYMMMAKLIARTHPDELYHLAGRSFVGASFRDELASMNDNVIGTHHILATIKDNAPLCRFFFAASAEMFGLTTVSPQNETTHPHPSSPYGISKTTSFMLTRYYREVHKVHASSGILYNHESPRRGPLFVTRKIAMAVAHIARGLQEDLVLGNLDARRDWGYAPEYVSAMWSMLQQQDADDYVLATGEAHTIRRFVTAAFRTANIHIEWKGERGTPSEIAVDTLTGKTLVRVDPEFFRPIDIRILMGDASKARLKLGWYPTTTFEALVKTMVEAELSRLA